MMNGTESIGSSEQEKIEAFLLILINVITTGSAI